MELRVPGNMQCRRGYHQGTWVQFLTKCYCGMCFSGQIQVSVIEEVHYRTRKGSGNTWKDLAHNPNLSVGVKVRDCFPEEVISEVGPEGKQREQLV